MGTEPPWEGGFLYFRPEASKIDPPPKKFTQTPPPGGPGGVGGWVGADPPLPEPLASSIRIHWSHITPVAPRPGTGVGLFTEHMAAIRCF